MALLLVLWVFMTLGVLALDFSHTMRDDAQAALNVAEETRAYFVAVAGINGTLWQYLENEEQGGDLQVALPSEVAFPIARADGQWHEGTFRDAKFRVRMTAESGRVPINCGIEDGDDETRQGLLTAVVTNLLRGGNRTEGIDRHEDKQIRTIVDSILDWADPDGDRRSNGAENAYYRSLVPPYSAKNNIITSPEELLGVQGMTADLLYGTPGRPGLRDVITVYQTEDGAPCAIDGRHISAATVQALLGLEAEAAAQMVSERDAALDAEKKGDGMPLQEIEGAFETAALQGMPSLRPEVVAEFFVWDDDNLETFLSIEAEAEMQAERNRSHVMAVIQVEQGGGGGQQEVSVKRWYDRAPWSFESSQPPSEAGEPPS